MRVEYIDVSKGTYIVDSIFIPAPEKIDVPIDSEGENVEVDWKQIHAETHLLRLRIGTALQRIQCVFLPLS